MSRSELAEWLGMIAVIVAWWPPLFAGWAPLVYRYPLYVGSFVVMGVIFWRRLGRVREGLAFSEQMMQARFAAERQVRGGDPSLDEKTPPDVSASLPFMPHTGQQDPREPSRPAH